jgi:hypothetical protein
MYAIGIETSLARESGQKRKEIDHQLAFRSKIPLVRELLYKLTPVFPGIPTSQIIRF